MVDEREILKKVLVEEKDLVKDLQNLVDKAKEIFLIENPSGRILFKDFSKQSDPNKICVLLSGKYFAKKLLTGFGVFGKANYAGLYRQRSFAYLP